MINDCNCEKIQFEFFYKLINNAIPYSFVIIPTRIQYINKNLEYVSISNHK